MQIRQAAAIVRQQGVRWAAFRARYAFEQRVGLLERRTPTAQWEARPLKEWLRPDVPAEPGAYAAWRTQHGGRFFFDAPVQLGARFGAKAPLAADAILEGRWPYFSGEPRTVGFPPDWFRDPDSGHAAQPALHWSRDAGGPADIKLVWEPSRFAAAFVLARAYAVRRDERYAAGFWTLIEDWMQRNPPMHGPNWGCGQEGAFRVMAWCFGLAAFAGSPTTTPARLARIATAIAWHGERIESNIAYARSQRNNHAISEALGLWTIGLLFPEFANAGRWRDAGRRDLEAEVEHQIYSDGSYVQHSTNYHRLMLQDLTWAIRLGELNGCRLSDALYARSTAAVEWLFSVTDPVSGEAPNIGHNDGALILPLSDCDFLDQRPTVQAASWLLRHEKPFSAGPWDEPLQWLFGKDALTKPSSPRVLTSFQAPVGGYFTLRGPESWALLRASVYKDRPAHADQLHLDVWWRGLNVACDAGTWRYTSPDGDHNVLSGSAVHNTVTVDGRDQMKPAGRFLWLDWAAASVDRVDRIEGMELMEARHDGYASSHATHRRAVLRAGDVWVVVDDIVGRGTHEARLQWLCPEAPFVTEGATILLDYPQGPFSFVLAAGGASWDVESGGADGPRGWRSVRYGVRQPALSLVAVTRGLLPLRLISVLGPAPVTVDASDAQVRVSSDGRPFIVQLSAPGETSIVAATSWATVHP